MRLFIAVCLSDAMKSALIDAQNEFYARGIRAHYAPEENLHLTLAFIGEYPDADAVAETLAAVRFRPFSLTLDGLGAFGDLWWAGLRRSEPLFALARSVRHALAQSGIPYDRKRFSPHITLLRRAKGALPGIGIPETGMTVDAFSLMRSDRGKRGMVYTEIERFPAEHV